MVLLLAVYIAAMAFLAVPALHAQELCFVCHAANAKAFSEFVMGAKGLGCFSCHRDAPEHEKDPTTVVVKPIEFEKVCADCHPKEEIAARVTKLKADPTIGPLVTTPARHAALAVPTPVPLTPTPTQPEKGIWGPVAIAAIAIIAILALVLYLRGRRKQQ